MIDFEFVRQFALSLEGVVELPHFEKASFRVKGKIFLTLDVPNHRVCVKLSEMDQSLFSAFDKSVVYPIPNKWGKMGYTFVELKSVPLETLQDLITTSYQTVLTPKKKPNKER